jgi:hypothetical protein
MSNTLLIYQNQTITKKARERAKNLKIRLLRRDTQNFFKKIDFYNFSLSKIQILKANNAFISINVNFCNQKYSKSLKSMYNWFSDTSKLKKILPIFVNDIPDI